MLIFFTMVMNDSVLKNYFELNIATVRIINFGTPQAFKAKKGQTLVINLNR